MNSRIEELANDAFAHAQTRHSQHSPELIHTFTSKFAELIIDECAQALWTDECSVSDLAMEQFNSNRKKIKQHFEG